MVPVVGGNADTMLGYDGHEKMGARLMIYDAGCAGQWELVIASLYAQTNDDCLSQSSAWGANDSNHLTKHPSPLHAAHKLRYSQVTSLHMICASEGNLSGSLEIACNQNKKR